MKKAVLLILLGLLSAAGGMAATGNITAASTDCLTAGSCVVTGISTGVGAIAVSLSGTFNATVQFEATAGTTWVAVQGVPLPTGTAATSATATGTWQFNVAGMVAMRVRASAYASGTVVVRTNPTTAVAKSVFGPSAGGAAIGGTGTADTVPKFSDSTTLADSLFTDDGVTPRYNGAQLATIGDIPSGEGIANINRPISGCGVVYTGSGLDFIVSACTYYIAGSIHTSAQTPLTLDAANADDDRIDVFIVDDTGAASFITGTPATPPAAPSVNPTTQLFLGPFAFVAEDATTPSNITEEVIYKEDAGQATEWDCVESDASTNCASTNNPYAGTKDVEWTTAARNDYVELTDGAAHTMAAYNNLVFYVRSKATWASNRNLSITFRLSNVNVGNAVVLSQGAFGFNSSNTSSYQQIVIPVASFGAIGTVDEMRFTVTGTGGAQTIGLYLDNVTLQGGLSGPTLPDDLMLFKGTWNATATYEQNDVVVSSSIAYVALAANTNSTPPSANWQVVGDGITGYTLNGNTTVLQTFTGADPATNDCAKFDANNNLVTAGAACGSGSGPAHFDLICDTPRSSTLQGNSFWTVGARTDIDQGHWEFVKEVDGKIACHLTAPRDTTAATVKLTLAANATSGVSTLQVGWLCLADSASLNGSLTDITAQDVTVDATAYDIKVVTFTLGSQLTAGQYCMFEISHLGTTDGDDTLAVNTEVYSIWLSD